MAVSLVSTIQTWIGLSTDAKPDATLVGSTFHELDTGKKFIWDGDSWVQDLSCIYCVYQGMLGMPSES